MLALPPQLSCRELPEFAPDDLDAIRAAFAGADGCALGQSWLPRPEPDFAPATVRVGWRGDSLLVFAELEDADIFTRATAHNQRMWELGDVMEMFLSAEKDPAYLELHVTPANWRFQLRTPDSATLRKAQAEDSFDHLLLADGVFRSLVWIRPENRKWFVFAEIPAAGVCGANRPLAGAVWNFSFSRYDYVRGRKSPIYSSSSPHVRLDYHRREEWGAIRFLNHQ